MADALLPLSAVLARPRVLPLWLRAVDIDTLAVMVITRALECVGACEVPPSSNRGPEVDAWNTASGAPLASYWCGSFGTTMWRESGAETAGIGHDPSCDQFMQWAIRTGRFSKAPALGAMVLYGAAGLRADHMEIIIRVDPYLQSVGGNRAWGGAYSRNGEAVICGRVDTTRVLGYAHLRPLNKGA